MTLPFGSGVGPFYEALEKRRSTWRAPVPIFVCAYCNRARPDATETCPGCGASEVKGTTGSGLLDTPTKGSMVRK